jgi:Cu/Ag efflux protein CusF
MRQRRTAREGATMSQYDFDIFLAQEKCNMKRLAWILVPTFLMLVQSTFAQSTAPTPTKATPASFAEGEVRRLDLAAGTILLKHGEISNIGMGPMTMAFKLKDPKQAAGLAVGDKVKFTAEQKGEALIVTSIQKTK